MKRKQFNQAQIAVLTEIYRRLNYYHKGNVDEVLMLQAVPSDVRCIDKFDFIKPYKEETPRIYNWYSLTEKGK
jgi:acyl-[acyl carrier protein]--UDP-N-acetylglucosamine O-acyltransferase